MENNILVENVYGHGGIKDTPDERDYQFVAEGTMPFDWNTGFDIETIVGTLPVKNQYSSFSCGGQAWASYSYVLDITQREEKSAKFIYAQTNIPPGGSNGRTNCQLCVSKGVSAEMWCSSYLPDKTTTEAFMTAIGDITTQAYTDALTNKELVYLAVNTDIETVAQAIRDNKGVVLGVSGCNNGTWLSPFPQAQQQADSTSWNHWLYAGKTKVVDGIKYIGVLNSWGTSVGENGWQFLNEDFFKNGLVWNCWTMTYNSTAPQRTLKIGMTGLDVKALQTALGITADGIFGRQTQLAVINFQKANGLVPDGVVGVLTYAKLQ